jgi:hypothetical protein
VARARCILRPWSGGNGPAAGAQRPISARIGEPPSRLRRDWSRQKTVISDEGEGVAIDDVRSDRAKLPPKAGQPSTGNADPARHSLNDRNGIRRRQSPSRNLKVQGSRREERWSCLERVGRYGACSRHQRVGRHSACSRHHLCRDNPGQQGTAEHEEATEGASEKEGAYHLLAPAQGRPRG